MVALYGALEIGVVAVPATAMIATGHTWIGAATVAVALAASVVQERLRIRAMTQRHERLLSTAEMAWSVGADPAPLIKALQRSGRVAGDAGPDDELPPGFHRPRPRGR